MFESFQVIADSQAAGESPNHRKYNDMKVTSYNVIKIIIIISFYFIMNQPYLLSDRVEMEMKEGMC